MARVLVIDSSPDARATLIKKVRQAGEFTVHSAPNSAEGMRFFDEVDIDCVLLDATSDQHDVQTALAAINGAAGYVPVIILANSDTGAGAGHAGAHQHLDKATLDTTILGGAIRMAVKDSQKDRQHYGIKATQKRILLIEDNADDREYIADMIKQGFDGAHVKAVATGDAALSFLREFGSDCVISDYRLEAEDGLNVLAELKAISPLTPVIMLTGQGNEEIAAASIKVGAADYLVKQRLAQAYLRAAIENAISRSALEAKIIEQDAERRQFLNILVHDLRQPLRNVRMLGDLAISEAEEGNTEEFTKLLTMQSAVATRADNLILTLESYSMLDQEVTFAPLTLEDAANAAVDNLAASIAERHAEVTLGTLPKIFGNATQIMQLFQNLIGNGLKYNENDRPKITIETQSESADCIVIIIKDNGLGIPEKFQKTIFAPLKRLWRSDEYEGTGLGLAICQKIVERHDGSIWCTSVEGQGSQFFVRFPPMPKDLTTGA